MRPVKRGDTPKDLSGVAVVFTKHTQSRDSLIKAIGDFCSYCENALHSDIDVEHVQPKDGKPLLALTWDNFLLACKYCNRAKWDKAITLCDYFWPDRDNTFRAFAYAFDQPPVPATGLTPNQRTIAEETIKLTGLDRVPGHPHFSDRDRRFIKRRDAWGAALLALKQYQAGEITAGNVAQMAVPRGFFSVWMMAFGAYPEVRKVLISQFKADANCFDPTTTEPIPRLGGQL